MSRGKRNRQKERQRRERDLERRAREIFARTPQLEPGEAPRDYQRRVFQWMDEAEREAGEDVGEIMQRVHEMSKEKAEGLLRARHGEDEVRPEDRPILASEAAAAFVRDTNADVAGMLRRHQELCRRAGAPVRAVLRVGRERVCVFRHPDEACVRMWILGEHPDDERGPVFRGEEAN